MAIDGPTFIRRQLGRQLRMLRKAAGKTELDVEEANLASRVKLWRLETGKVTAKVGDVRGLCWLYGASTQTTDALTVLAVSSNALGYWENHQDSPAWSSLYIAAEALADEIRVYQNELVPDLLQTSDYLRAVRLAVAPDETESVLRERVKLHVERQEVTLSRDPVPRLVVILGASALERPVGGNEVMAEQLRQLHQISRNDRVDIRVLPSKAGPHQAMRVGGFSIVDFRNADDPPVVHVETLTGSRYLERMDELGKYRRTFRHLYDKTISIDAHRT